MSSDGAPHKAAELIRRLDEETGTVTVIEIPPGERVAAVTVVVYTLDGDGAARIRTPRAEPVRGAL